MSVALLAISLFSGGGGLDLGLERAGIARTVCRVEHEAYAAAVLAARSRDGALDDAPVWSDVSTFDGKPWRGVVDLVAGGFPCQDISSAGKGAGIIEGARSGLWREFARIIREVEPRYVFVENVSALIVRGLDVVLGDLASLGFDAEWGVFRASDVGAPHRRERVFILADREGRGQRVVGDAARARGGRHAHRDGLDLAHPVGVEPERRRGAGDIPCPPPPPAREAPERERGRDSALDRGSRRTERVALPKCVRPEGLQPTGTEARPVERGSGADLADAEPHRRSERSEAYDDDGRDAPGNDADGRDADVGHALVDGHGGQLHAGDCVPWPPGPGDAEGWQSYLERWPATQPALRRGADGMAHRTQRLRLLGNGVVPQQARLAWEVLMQRMRASEPGEGAP
ncbi:MAG: DNA cytosine methyltransferase, partial [Deltaproteobacteria bacterium]